MRPKKFLKFLMGVNIMVPCCNNMSAMNIQKYIALQPSYCIYNLGTFLIGYIILKLKYIVRITIQWCIMIIELANKRRFCYAFTKNWTNCCKKLCSFPTSSTGAHYFFIFVFPSSYIELIILNLITFIELYESIIVVKIFTWAKANYFRDQLLIIRWLFTIDYLISNCPFYTA